MSESPEHSVSIRQVLSYLNTNIEKLTTKVTLLTSSVNRSKTYIWVLAGLFIFELLLSVGLGYSVIRTNNNSHRIGIIQTETNITYVRCMSALVDDLTRLQNVRAKYSNERDRQLLDEHAAMRQVIRAHIYKNEPVDTFQTKAAQSLIDRTILEDAQTIKLIQSREKYPSPIYKDYCPPLPKE